LEPSPAALLAILDARLGETLELGSFVTMFYGVLDTERSELTYASAGHSPLLVYRHDGAQLESRRSKGIPLGAVRGGAIRATLRDETIRLAPGDVLVQFTDGVNEAFDPSGQEQFGFERLEATVRAAAPRGVDAVLDEVHRAVEAFAGSGPALDDESMLVISRAPANGTARLSAAGPDPIAALAAARAAGRVIKLRADDLGLTGFRDWLDGCPGVAAQDRLDVEIIHAVLHEVSTNIGEHGYGGDPSRRFEVWYVPGDERGPDRVGDADGRSLRFLIRDDGQPFNDARWHPTDFSDRSTWKRGRGYGLDIIHRGARAVSYHPKTAEGNITLVVFDHDSTRSAHKEQRHA
jgi:anti-sigma regulatory factor (Ser/Thr protein kinase)